MTNNEAIQGKWDRHGDDFVASVRVGGRASEFVGRACSIRAKSGERTIVQLGEVIADYGADDVAIFRVVRL